MSGATELTAFEAEVYDRQIRLWGVDAQHRIRSSRVLVSGLGALGAEVAKNLVLAGVSVTLQDDVSVTPADVGVQFLLRDAHAGMNVRPLDCAQAARAAREGAQPRVDSPCALQLEFGAATVTCRSCWVGMRRSVVAQAMTRECVRRCQHTGSYPPRPYSALRHRCRPSAS